MLQLPGPFEPVQAPGVSPVRADERERGRAPRVCPLNTGGKRRSRGGDTGRRRGLRAACAGPAMGRPRGDSLHFVFVGEQPTSQGGKLPDKHRGLLV